MTKTFFIKNFTRFLLLQNLQNHTLKLKLAQILMNTKYCNYIHRICIQFYSK